MKTVHITGLVGASSASWVGQQPGTVEKGHSWKKRTAVPYFAITSGLIITGKRVDQGGIATKSAAVPGTGPARHLKNGDGVRN